MEEIRHSGKQLTVSVRMTTDVRKKREDVTLPGGEKRKIASGTPAEVRQTIDRFAEMGLDYFCASIMHPSAADISADLKKFAGDVVRSYS